MKLVKGVWLPDEEQEMSKFLESFQVDGVGVYQYQKLLEALKHVRNFRTAIDIGAHCGLWSMQLKKRFQLVVAFEPVPEHCAIHAMNCPDAELHQVALGDREGTVRLSKGIKSTGDTHITLDGEYEARLERLDSFDVKDVDFIKLDCEGYELFALRGGEETIDEYRPVIIVEQKPGKAKSYGLDDTEAVEWLKKKGYSLKAVLAGDYILTPT